MSPSPRHTLPPAARVRSKNDFDRIFRQGIRASDRWITLLADLNAEPLARLGISVSRRFGNAVRRNRIKRLIREAFRAIRHELPPGTDWIVIPRTGQDREPTLPSLRDSFLRLSARLTDRLTLPADLERRSKPPARQATDPPEI